MSQTERQSIRDKDAHLCCPINPTETRTCYNALKFRKFLFRGCKGEVENFLVNQRPGRRSLLTDRPIKNTNLVDDFKYLPPVKFRQIPFSGCR